MRFKLCIVLSWFALFALGARPSTKTPSSTITTTEQPTTTTTNNITTTTTTTLVPTIIKVANKTVNATVANVNPTSNGTAVVAPGNVTVTLTVNVTIDGAASGAVNKTANETVSEIAKGIANGTVNTTDSITVNGTVNETGNGTSNGTTANGTVNATANGTVTESDDETKKAPDEDEASKGFMNEFGIHMAKMWHCVIDDYHEPTPKDVRFFLYTRRNRVDSEEVNLTFTDSIQEQIHQLGVNPLRQTHFVGRSARKHRRSREAAFVPLSNSSVLKSSYYNVGAKTKILIHGYTESSQDKRMLGIKRAYLSNGDFNVIMVDWRVLAKPPCYVTATRYTKFVGAMVAKLIDQLQLSDVDLSSIHVIGFSLGAHIAGFAGNKVVRGNIFRITGLDPALPLFMTDDLLEKLDRTDAQFVDIIHSNSGILGINGPVGHVDFYPNGGRQQPGCDMSDVFCSHSRAPEYFIESVTSTVGFKAYKCPSYKDFKNNACNGTTDVIMMGEPCKGGNGTYYLHTNAAKPYAMP